MNIGREIRESTIRKLTNGRTGTRTVRERGTPIPMQAGDLESGFNPNDEGASTTTRDFTIGLSAIGGADPIA